MTDFQAARTAMVDGQIRPSDVTLYPIIEAMLQVPREVFVPADKRSIAYAGHDIALENGRKVLAPRILAKMLEELDIQPDELVLNIGAALGYSTAVVACLAEAVVAVEQDETLARDAETLLSEQSVDNAVVHCGDLVAGAREHGAYDVIMIEGGVEILPDSLLEQLKDGGRIAAIFVDGQKGQCRIGIKGKAAISWDTVFDATAAILPGFAALPAFSL